MHKSADELITFFQSDLMLNFGHDDDYVVQSLVISMQELRRMKLDRPAAPRPGDAVEKPTKPFGSFEPPTIVELIASMQVEATNGGFVGRPSIPPDGGPVIVPDALLKRNASDWSFLDRENDDISSSHVSAAATDCPSSRTSLVSSLLDSVGCLETTNEPGIVSFVEADCAVSSRTTLTDWSPDIDQISNSEYDNVPKNRCDEFSSIYEQELEQTLESIEQEIQQLLAGGEKHQVIHSDPLCYQPASASVSTAAAVQRNHLVDSCSPHSSTQLDSLVTCELNSSTAEHAAIPSPSMVVLSATDSVPVMSWSDVNSCQTQKTIDSVSIPIHHLPAAAPVRPPVRPKPKNVSTSPSAKSPVLTPIPVLHLRTVPISQFTGISALSATNRSVPTSSTNGC